MSIESYTARAIARCVRNPPHKPIAMMIDGKLHRGIASSHLSKRGRRFAKLVMIYTRWEWRPHRPTLR